MRYVPARATQVGIGVKAQIMGEGSGRSASCSVPSSWLRRIAPALRAVDIDYTENEEDAKKTPGQKISMPRSPTRGISVGSEGHRWLPGGRGLDGPHPPVREMLMTNTSSRPRYYCTMSWASCRRASCTRALLWLVWYMLPPSTDSAGNRFLTMLKACLRWPRSARILRYS
jgi:hypothetical protein